jgi:hypothetical protein
LIVKPLFDPVDAGEVVARLVKGFGITDPGKQLIIAYGDTGVLEGSISIQRKAIQHHNSNRWI